MGVIFAKTRKGQDEIATKSGDLTPRIRRVLIFVDGKRSVDELRDMLQSDDLQHTLGRLEEEGYIEVSATTDAGGQLQPPAAALSAITAFRELPDPPDLDQLAQARNFMINTLNTFVGSLGASSLIDRIEAGEDHASLRLLFDEWYHAIVMSRNGRRQAENLRSMLLTVI